MTSRLLVPFWILCVFLVGGCHPAPSLIGEWKGKLFDNDAKVDLKDDKSAVVHYKAGDIGADFTGTYEATPKILTLTLNDYKLSGGSEQLAPLAKAFLDPLKGRVMKIAYQFNSQDEVALTYNNKTDVLTREKTE